MPSRNRSVCEGARRIDVALPAMTAVTAITAQNTVGVQCVHVLDPGLVRAQIESVAEQAMSARMTRTAFLRGAHLRSPVHVILVLEHQGDGAPDGHATTHSAHDSSDVCLDLLAAATTMSALPPSKVAAQVLLGDLESRWKSVDDHSQLRSVRFAGGQPSQH